ncbi:Uncharacterised protein [Vibrio cholerae]|uniref:Uncharacterized protein n=1 Tax=Vibrio cholerae TaxID=666 RepID=A0A656A111_VIBCL|nr:Uncharacterised protein [Vibrio cholerae]CSC90805.1 Uncharacterised protein [Vibrio cholerae]CSD75058.1 Uncharacterised protein [Vibrio cholerae]
MEYALFAFQRFSHQSLADGFQTRQLAQNAIADLLQQGVITWANLLLSRRQSIGQ